jgi:hypothetical protein
MKKEKTIMLLAAFGVAAVGVLLFGVFAMWWGLNIPVNPQTVANVLAPLVLTAGFIERAVEVVITPWRDPGKKKQAALEKANANNNAAGPSTSSNSLDDYVGETTWYAFTVAFMFGLVAAMVGVRALWPFLEASPQAIAAFGSLPLGQRNTFIVFDVVISAALLAGGANGLHSPINAFTSFFDASAQKSQNSAKAQPQGAAQS